MGKGQRHSKNAGTMGSEGLTYNEKRALGFGTVRERLGKDSVGNFDDCRLTLRPATDPVCTPHGFIFSKEAIIENLLAQKKANKRKLAAWEAQQQELQRKAAERATVEEGAKLLAFDRQNHMGASARLAATLQEAITQEAEALLADKRTVSGAVNIAENLEKMKEMRAFWLPSKTPEAADLLERPDQATYCPASGKKLRLKDLIPVRFTRMPEESGAGAGAGARYMDPVTRTTLTNAHRLVLLAPTGDVLLAESYKKCVEPDGVYDGRKVGPKDVVELQGGGTGFAAHDGDRVQASKHWALGPGSGKADLRGQHQGPRSAGGLIFTN